MQQFLKHYYVLWIVAAGCIVLVAVLLIFFLRARAPAEPVPHSYPDGFGISVGDDFIGLSDSELAARFDHFASLGITWVRFDADWSHIQPDDGAAYDWGVIDRIVAVANSRHMHVLPILDFTPGWARSPGCNASACAPRSAAEFAQFAAAAVSRYAPLGVHAWEIWNEPNIKRFWQPAPDAPTYARLLVAAYAAIKNADPSAVVISGGLSPSETRDGNISPTDFLSSLYQHGAAGSFDALGFHPYSFPVLPSYPASSNAWQQMSNTNPSLRSIMARYGDSGKKIWITEYGAPTNGPGAEAQDGSYNFLHNADHVSEALQAHMMEDAVAQARQLSFVGPLFWYTYIDQGTSTDTIENFFGIFRYDGSPKPAYAVLKQILATP